MSQTVTGVKAENRIGILAHGWCGNYNISLAIMIIMSLFASNLFIVNLFELDVTVLTPGYIVRILMYAE